MPSQVTKTVQENPRICMKPKLRFSTGFLPRRIRSLSSRLYSSEPASSTAELIASTFDRLSSSIVAILRGTDVESLFADSATLLLISLRSQLEVRQQPWFGHVSALHIFRPRRCILNVFRQVLWRLCNTACLYLLGFRIFRTTNVDLTTTPPMTASRPCPRQQKLQKNIWMRLWGAVSHQLLSHVILRDLRSPASVMARFDDPYSINHQHIQNVRAGALTHRPFASDRRSHLTLVRLNPSHSFGASSRLHPGDVAAARSPDLYYSRKKRGSNEFDKGSRNRPSAELVLSTRTGLISVATQLIRHEEICEPILTYGPIMYTNDTMSDDLPGLPTHGNGLHGRNNSDRRPNLPGVEPKNNPTATPGAGR